MNLIVAVDNKWGIGKKNDLLFSLPLDMKYFREKTLNKTVVMGYNTLLSFPGGKPLPKRRNIVLCPDNIDIEGAERVGSVAELAALLGKRPDGDVYIIGGASVYNLLMPCAEYAYITKVETDGGAEVFIKDYDKADGWTLVSQSEKIVDNGFTLSFCVYRNSKVAPLI